jgi:4'-phosphopantetheinyl transferase
MPLKYIKHIAGEETLIGLWNISESEDELIDILESKNVWHELKDEYTKNNFTHSFRRLEWLGVRLLLYKMLPNEKAYVQYYKNGKPYLKNSGYSISISHKKHLIAIALSKKEHLGLDLEIMSDKILRIQQKFATGYERSFIHHSQIVSYLYIIWCAKEAMYKLYGKQNMFFLRNFQVKPFDIHEKGELTGLIITDIEQEIKLNYNFEDDYLIVWGTK